MDTSYNLKINVLKIKIR